MNERLAQMVTHSSRSSQPSLESLGVANIELVFGVRRLNRSMAIPRHHLHAAITCPHIEQNICDEKTPAQAKPTP
jgi:hypothetical protein